MTEPNEPNVEVNAEANAAAPDDVPALLAACEAQRGRRSPKLPGNAPAADVIAALCRRLLADPAPAPEPAPAVPDARPNAAVAAGLRDRLVRLAARCGDLTAADVRAAIADLLGLTFDQLEALLRAEGQEGGAA